MRRIAAQLAQAVAHAAVGRAAPAATSALQECSGTSVVTMQRHLCASALHRAAGKGEETTLRWPLPAEVLAANPELAQAALADAAQARVQEGDAAQMFPDTAAESLHYRDSTGSEARLGGVMKRRFRKQRPPPSDAALAPHPMQLTTMTPDEVAEVLAHAHARDVVVLDVRQTCDFADSMVIATGNSDGHVRAVARAVHSKMKENRPEELSDMSGFAPLQIEGSTGSDWTIVDAGTLIVHVLTDEARQDYNLEGLWAKHGGIRRIESSSQVQTLSTMRV